MQIESTNGEEFRVDAEGQKPQFFTAVQESINAFHVLCAARAKKVRRYRRLPSTQWECVDFTVS